MDALESVMVCMLCYCHKNTQSLHTDISDTSLTLNVRGHGGRVVTLSPPTSEAGVRSQHGLKWESW